MNYYRFVIGFLVCTAAFFVQIRFGSLGFGLGNAVFIVLVTLAFFLDVVEECALAVVMAYILHWEPIFSVESVMLVVFPTAVCMVKDWVSITSLITHICALVVGITAWYALIDIQLIFRFSALIAYEIFLGVIYGGVMFAILQYSFSEERAL
ncbi:MAG: hypothetical protein NUV53_01465 [Patescibacteria group bacterium]|nr:hypothetical protein [Patescibacteria group bacterium]